MGKGECLTSCQWQQNRIKYDFLYYEKSLRIFCWNDGESGWVTTGVQRISLNLFAFKTSSLSPQSLPQIRNDPISLIGWHWNNIPSFFRIISKSELHIIMNKVHSARYIGWSKCRNVHVCSYDKKMLQKLKKLQQLLQKLQMLKHGLQ